MHYYRIPFLCSGVKKNVDIFFISRARFCKRQYPARYAYRQPMLLHAFCHNPQKSAQVKLARFKQSLFVNFLDVGAHGKHRVFL